MTDQSEISKDTDIVPRSQVVGYDDPFLPDLVGREEANFQEDLSKRSDEMQATLNLGNGSAVVDVSGEEATPIHDVEPDEKRDSKDQSQLRPQDESTIKQIVAKLFHVKESEKLSEIQLSVAFDFTGNWTMQLIQLATGSPDDFSQIYSEICDQEVSLCHCATDTQASDFLGYYFSLDRDELVKVLSEDHVQALEESIFDGSKHHLRNISFIKRLDSSLIVTAIAAMQSIMTIKNPPAADKKDLPTHGWQLKRQDWQDGLKVFEDLQEGAKKIKKAIADLQQGAETQLKEKKGVTEIGKRIVQLEGKVETLKAEQSTAGVTEKRVNELIEGQLDAVDLTNLVTSKQFEERTGKLLTERLELSQRLDTLKGQLDAVDMTMTNLVKSEQFEQRLGEVVIEKTTLSQRLDALEKQLKENGAIKTSIAEETAARAKAIRDLPKQIPNWVFFAILAFCVVNLAISLGGIFLPRQTTQIEQPATVETQDSVVAPVQPVVAKEKFQDYRPSF